MKKVISSALTLGGVIAVAWWMGGMMYFIMVAKHFRDEEKNENAKDSSASNTSDRIHSWVKPDNKASAPVEVHNPTKYPERSHDKFPRGVDNLSAKWRSYYYSKSDHN